jgi:FkbM family methyltransferase
MARAVKALLVLAVLGTVSYFWAPPRLIALKILGRAHGCPLVEAVASNRYSRRMLRAADAIAKGSRIVAAEPGFRLWQTPRGRFWAPAGGGAALRWELAEQDKNIYGDGEHGVRAGDIVLDCGANVGVYTGVALAAGARLVVAIEPAPESLECLRRNFAAQIQNGRVIVCAKGVWDRDGALAINQDPGNSAAGSFVVTTPQMRKGPVLPLTTIDGIVAGLNLARVDFIKMDIEGAEAKALAGARATLAKFHPRMALAAYHRPDDVEKLPETARRAWPGYHVECGACRDGGSVVMPVSIFLY